MSEASQTPSRFAETLFDILDQVSYRRVNVEDVHDPVYRLRYEAYRREDFIDENEQGITKDLWDDAPNSHTFGVYIGQQLASSIRLHVASPKIPISPSRTMWPDILDGLMSQGDSYIDPSRFTADRELSLAFPALPFLTLRLAVMATEHFKARYCISSVRREHGAFYRRVFQSKQMGEEAFFPGLRFGVNLYVADAPAVRGSMRARYPFFRSSQEEREGLFGTAAGNQKVMSTARKARLEESHWQPEPA